MRKKPATPPPPAQPANGAHGSGSCWHGAMKQQILERARSTAEGFLHRQCADTTLSVLSVNPEVDGYGDEFLLTGIGSTPPGVAMRFMEPSPGCVRGR